MRKCRTIFGSISGFFLDANGKKYSRACCKVIPSKLHEVQVLWWPDEWFFVFYFKFYFS